MCLYVSPDQVYTEKRNGRIKPFCFTLGNIMVDDRSLDNGHWEGKHRLEHFQRMNSSWFGRGA